MEILIGESTAERIKETIGCATPESELQEMEIRGRNLAEGVPNTLSISSLEVYEAMSGPLSSILQAIKNGLEQSPPELEFRYIRKRNCFDWWRSFTQRP